MSSIEEKIKCMTKEQKVAELRSYFQSCGLGELDMNHPAAIGAPDSVWDAALLKIAVAAGTGLGREPVTAQELAEALKDRDKHGLRWADSLRKK